MSDVKGCQVPQTPSSYGRPPSGWRRRLYNIIFEADTPAGRRFDIALIGAIMASILVVILDSVPSIRGGDRTLMYVLEWAFTLLFSVEYVARLVSVRHPLRYATSFFGIIDLLAVLPTYLSLLVPGSALLLDIRILRLLRVFRIFKLTLYIQEYTRLSEALVASRRKILVFLSVVLMLILVLGTLMYVVEGPENHFTSIPVAMYWAAVTMTTVGYGDITPQTGVGRAIASCMMLMGWGILAVPTGIVTAEMTSQGLARRALERAVRRHCRACGSGGHEPDARFCKDCGEPMPSEAHAR
ncbi:ion transporter [Massilia horti]|uniref:Ion transporter n=1 Tax=Massilia horti TaxID=2562153 RepID=A0A4Y9SYZ3_9BURK|nr:ion transporter [Massilia horti]TFW31678.1 ion transporter [Massilia horti]